MALLRFDGGAGAGTPPATSEEERRIPMKEGTCDGWDAGCGTMKAQQDGGNLFPLASHASLEKKMVP